MSIHKIYLKPGLWKLGAIEYPSHTHIRDLGIGPIGEPLAHPVDDSQLEELRRLGAVDHVAKTYTEDEWLHRR